jgi:hypothetical protein
MEPDIRPEPDFAGYPAGSYSGLMLLLTWNTEGSGIFLEICEVIYVASNHVGTCVPVLLTPSSFTNNSHFYTMTNW